MRRISCPGCGQAELFTVVQDIRVTIVVDATGRQVGGADYGNDGRHRWLVCPECGHSWRTSRHLELVVDVR